MPDTQFKKRVITTLAVALATGLIVIAAGCGSGQSQNQSGGQDIVASAGAGLSEPTLLAKDIPLDPGKSFVFWTNTAGKAATVDFGTNGPWDFSDGPTDATLTITNVAGSDAPSAPMFPDADVAAKLTWAPSRGPDEYNYQSLDDSSWRSYGKSGATGVDQYSTPVDALEFPCAVGKSWTNVYTGTLGGSGIGILEDVAVVGYNKLTVPAGTFDAFLVQSRIATSSGPAAAVTWDYIWIVPGIGRAAEIISEAGEEGPLFTKAYAVYRLKQY